MLSICLCDDDAASRKDVRELCEKITKELHVEGKYYEFSNAEALLVGCPPSPDIIFLDVIMGQLTGIDAAREIRKEDTSVTIVFMSNYATYAVEGYSVQAYRYLLKPVVEQRFRNELTDVFKDLSMRQRNTFTIRNEEGVFAVNPGKVMYIETKGNKNVCFNTTSGQHILCRGTMKHWDDAFEEFGFFRCHSAYLVNLAYVDEICSSDYLLLRDGSQIAVSRRRKTKLVKALTDYVSRRL
ncbi:MAG: LytTR family DNA-binding domain-containing protein [Eggerthellaceae bacterium]|jgi:DNA-binding LytR/AlgR family response regulator|nr:LytTR family DNA-binding domain-containing protein [Eggerthellaceae bacterium]MCH4221354.1 LytTR family DNA-binding domain-containing protein [Eggerthellaceae bacterium]